MNKAKRIAFLCSGGGGNLRFFHRASLVSQAPFEICVVVADRICAASEYAGANGIPSVVLDFQGDQKNLLSTLDDYRPDLVISTVNKILKKPITDRFKGKLINLHYSILPAFGGKIGTQPVKAALDYGTKFTGVTCHLVDDTLDGGKPIQQVAIPIHEDECDTTSLMNHVFRCGCLCLFTSAEQMFSQPIAGVTAVNMDSRPCLFSSVTKHLEVLNNQQFWQSINQ